ncbi:MAG: lamin tail domain-containing protein [Myxococcota bacterium]
MRVALAVVTALALTACRSESRLPHLGDDDDDVTGTDPTDPTDPVSDLDVVIDEVMPGNQSTVDAPDSADKPDWIELRNLGDAPVALSELVLRNGDGDRWTGPEGVSLEPNVPLLIWAREAPDDVLSTGFTLDKDNDKPTLLDLKTMRWIIHRRVDIGLTQPIAAPVARHLRAPPGQPGLHPRKPSNGERGRRPARRRDVVRLRTDGR